MQDSERPLRRLSNLELIEIINHPAKYTDEIISDAITELEYRKTHKPVRNENRSSNDFMSIMLFKTETIATPVFVWMNIIVFVICTLSGISPINPTHVELFKVGGMQQYHFLTGDWWRLFSSMFLHSGLLHIGFNMFALIQVGPIAERMIGAQRYAIIYLLCGVFGGLASISFGSDAVGVGASGAIFGIFGLTYFLLKSPKIQGDKAEIAYLRRQLGFFIVLNIIIGLSSKGISNAAHVGGLVTGAILCYVYLFNYPSNIRKIAGNVVAIGLSIATFFIWFSSMTPRHSFIADEVYLPTEIYEESQELIRSLYAYEELVKTNKIRRKHELAYNLPRMEAGLKQLDLRLQKESTHDYTSFMSALYQKLDYLKSNQDRIPTGEFKEI